MTFTPVWIQQHDGGGGGGGGGDDDGDDDGDGGDGVCPACRTCVTQQHL